GPGPAPVPEGEVSNELVLSSAVAQPIVAGRAHTCAILEGGVVKCWGANVLGELGLGDTAEPGGAPGQMGANLPTVSLGVGRSAKALATMSDHTWALLDNGEVKCWGNNSSGQLGLGSTTTRGDGP